MDSSDKRESINNRSNADKLRDDLKSRYGYDEMSDEQKRAFDEKIYEVIGQDSSEYENPD